MESRSMFSPSRTCPNPGPLSPREAPACVQNAMMKEKKPFTYTPGGLDLSEIKSEKMARRLMMNAMSPGVQEKPKPPSFTPETPTGLKPALHNYNMPVAVFPCIQIPPNPKELLRRTSGPYSRSESVEAPQTPQTPQIPIKQEDKKLNSTIPENDIIKACETMVVTKSPSPIVEPIKEEIKTVEPEEEEEEEDIPVEKEEVVDEEPMEEDSSDEDDYLQEDLPVDDKPYQPELDSDSSSSSSGSDSEYVQLDYSVTKAVEQLNLEPSKSIEPVMENEEIKDVEPVVTCQPDLNVTIINEDENKLIERDEPTDIIEDVKVNEAVNVPDDEQKFVEKGILDVESPVDRIYKEERTPSPYKKNLEIIKGLSDDLDSLPSLDISSKRFSFLSDSSTIEEQKKEEDPFSIITGIPPKISLIDRVEPMKLEKDTQSPAREFLAPWKPPNILPSLNNSVYNKVEQKDQIQLPEPTWKKVAVLKEDFRAPSPFKANTDDFWKKDLWNNKPVNRNESVSPIPAFLKDDPEPAWKKELRDIAIQKAESKDDEVEHKVIEEPPWRRELRELAQARGAKVLPIKEINLEEVIEPPWKQNQFRPWSIQEKPKPTPPPTWSQTLRPKSWKERNADLATPKPVEVPEWKRAMSPKISVTSPMERLNTLSTEVRKTPEITVEVVNQTPYKPTVVLNNGYVYPWESSSDSSAAFSPEPRTPTPQSRNSPFTHGQQFSTVPKEYATLSYQPRRPMLRTCPIQSRSFKYLQLLTGTDDDYEDDEPFIPQPPQHSRPKYL